MSLKRDIYKQIVHIAKGYARNHEGFRKWAKKLNYDVKLKKYQRLAKKTPTDPKLIYFNTFKGGAYSDSPKAIYEELLKDPRFDDYRFVWTFEEPESYRFLEKNPRTTVVQRTEKEEIDAINRAGWWITNYRMFDFYVPKKDQVYVQCWHGTPLKRLGYDITAGDNAMNSAEEIWEKYERDTKRFKYLISPTRWVSEKFTTAWNLKAFGKEDAIIEEGYPRNDRLINAGPEEVRALKEQLGLDSIEDRKIILYAPTWRDNQYTNGVGYTYKTEVDFDKLQRELGEDYVILFRAHYLVANEFDFRKYDGFIYDVSGHDDINDLYLVADLLVTDYSSVFFDYANLRRPIIYYMYDMDYYRDGLRGFYLSLDELPGPIVKEEDGLIASIRDLSENFQVDEKYRAFNDKFNYLDDGNATRRVIEKIFFSK